MIPSPLVGEGQGGGVSWPRRRQLSMFRSDRPPPQPSPTRGEGEGKRSGPITSGQFNGIEVNATQESIAHVGS
jgi:hypothetical protein